MNYSKKDIFYKSTTTYIHHAGDFYDLICVANKRHEWGAVAVYKNVSTGSLYARNLKEFRKKFIISPASNPCGLFYTETDQWFRKDRANRKGHYVDLICLANIESRWPDVAVYKNNNTGQIRTRLLDDFLEKYSRTKKS